MNYYRTYYLYLILAILFVALQLHPLYAQEEDANIAPLNEAQILPEDIKDSSVSTRNQAVDSAEEEVIETDETEPSGDAEVTEEEIQEIMRRMEARKNRVRKAKPLNYKVISRFPHRPTAFTQGIIVDGDTLIESSGGYGRSLLSKINLESGEVLAEQTMPPYIFAEGVTRFKDSLYQLSYKRGIAMVYDAETLQLDRQHQYGGEGWGITSNGRHLIMSDGSDTLRYINPKDFKEVRRLSVTQNGQPLKYLNELEWVDGKIYANVWLRNKVVIINPNTGIVKAYVDLKELLDEVRTNTKTGVLNGIAYDAEGKKLYVTGKNWPTLFEIKIES